MENNWASENLQTIRTLMERSALYRRALAPIMLTVGTIGCLAGGIAFYLERDSAPAFICFWLITGMVALGISFLLVRRQSIKDSEPFWSPPTRRVALALAPPLAVGFLFAALDLISITANRQWFLNPGKLPGLWMIFYGCAIYSAGFFMVRGIRLLGVIFLFLGVISLSLTWIDFDYPRLLLGNICMGATFGAVHFACGVYLFFTERKKNEA